MKSITVEIDETEQGNNNLFPHMVVQGELTVSARNESEIAGRGADEIEEAIKGVMKRVVEESYEYDD